MLSGHTDVVPVDGQPWDTDPWTLTLKDGKYYGRGTCDMKAFYAIGARHAAGVQEGAAQAADPFRAVLRRGGRLHRRPCAGRPHGERGAAAARHHHRRADHDDGGPRPQGRADLHHQVHRLRGAFLDDPSRRQRHPFRRRVHPLPQPGAGRARGQGAQGQRVHAGRPRPSMSAPSWAARPATSWRASARCCGAIASCPASRSTRSASAPSTGWKPSCCPG